VMIVACSFPRKRLGIFAAMLLSLRSRRGRDVDATPFYGPI
jgi:hypothetical protein